MDVNPCNIPSRSVGPKFAAQPDVDSEHSKRAQKRQTTFKICTTPTSKKLCSNTESESNQPPPTLIATPDKSLAERRGSQTLDSEENVSYISNESDNLSEQTSHSFTSSMTWMSSPPGMSASTDVSATVNASLVARIQFLEGENRQLRQQLSLTGKKVFRIEQIMHDDSLVSLSTGFPSYDVLLSFFEFLGPGAYNLHYHGSKSKGKRRRKNKAQSPQSVFHDVGET